MFFTAGLSINCACFLKQSCIADSLCAASKAAEDAKAMARVAAVSNAFMADSFGERTCKTAVFGSPAARLATKIIAAHVVAPPWTGFLGAPACSAAAARGRRSNRYATGTTNIDNSGAVIIPPTMRSEERRVGKEC